MSGGCVTLNSIWIAAHDRIKGAPLGSEPFGGDLQLTFWSEYRDRKYEGWNIADSLVTRRVELEATLNNMSLWLFIALTHKE